MPKSKRGFYLALIGLLVGLMIGIAIRVVEYQVSKEVALILADEVSQACECTFEIGPINLSLLRLKASATNARILKEGQPGLEVPYLTAQASLRDLLSGVIILDHIALHDALVSGFGEESALYLFLDHLTSPSESDSKPKFSVRLDKLSAHNATLFEDIDDVRVSASGVSLWVHNTLSNDFLLTPTIESLEILQLHEDSAPELIIGLGELSGRVLLEGRFTYFQDILLRMPESLLSLEATSDSQQDNKLEGLTEIRLSTPSFDLERYVQATMQGSGDIGGTLGRPRLSIQLENLENKNVTSEIEGFEIIDLDSFSASVGVEVKDSDYLVEVTSARGAGSDHEVNLIEPIKVTKNSLSGAILLTIGSMTTPTGNLERVRASARLGGTIGKPTVDLDITASKFSTPAATLIDFQAKAGVVEQKISGSAAAKFSNGGQVSLKFELLQDQQGEFTLASSNLKVSQAVVHSRSNGRDSPDYYLLNGDLSASGPLDPSELSGTGNIRLTLPDGTPIEATLSISDGEVSVTDKSELLELSANVLLAEPHSISLQLATDSFSFLDQELECISIASTLDYLPGESLLTGDGTLTIDRLAFGCNQFRIQLTESVRYPIEQGRLNIPTSTFSGRSGEFSLAGHFDFLEGPDVRARGTIDLTNLLPFVDGVDDLRGAIETDLRVFGDFERTLFSGTVNLNDAEISIESAGVAASEVSGLIILNRDEVQIEDLSGILNSGSFDITGTIYPDNFEKSSIALNFQDLFFEPTPEMNVTLAGDISLASGDNGRGLIDGVVTIQQAELLKNIEITSILTEIPRMIFAPREDSRREEIELPDISLNLAVQASRNVFIITSYLGAELRGDLNLVGPLANPDLQGQLEIVTGWFGVRGRKFEITSGIITFEQPGNVPYLSLTSETYARTQTGENILIFLEAVGPAENPRVTLTSDRGLSQQELLTLVSSVADDHGHAFGRPGFDALTLDDTAEQDKRWFGLQGFFRRLTTLDSISIEPKTNPFRGQIEPTVIARKALPLEINLIGESYLTTDDARLIAQYYLTEKLKVEGILETLPNEDRNALGADLTYTVLAKQLPFTQIDYHGISRFRERELARTQRLSQYSRIPSGDLPQLEQSINRFFNERGNLDSEVDISCLQDNQYCRHIKVEIEEGTRYRINQIRLKEETLPESVRETFDNLVEATLSKRATSTTRETLIKDLIRALRNEGFISARVEGEYEVIQTDQEREAVLTLTATVGRPTSFTFEGNSHFSAEDFLETINLFDRRQPFGNNTIRILADNISQLYRDNGYREVNVEYSRMDSPEGDRVFYSIIIEEGEQSRIANISFEIDGRLSERELLSLIKGYEDGEFERRLLRARFPVREDLRNNTVTLMEVLINGGYPDPKVEYRIEDGDNDGEVSIIYQIEPGEIYLIGQVSIDGYPDTLDSPAALATPATVPQVNRYVRELTNSLKASGYRNPDIWTEAHQDEVIIMVVPGELVRIETIEISGNVQTSEDVIMRQLKFTTGDPWARSEIDHARRTLLRLGLFQRVEMIEQEGSDPELKKLVVRVDEKPLQTLEVGAGVNSEFGLHAFGEATDRELFRDGRALSFRFDGYFDESTQEISRGSAGLRFLHPNLFQSDHTYATDLRYEKFDLSSQEFNLDRVSLAHSIYRSLDNGITYAFGYTYMRDDLSRVTPGAILSPLDSGNVNLGFLSGSLSYDQRDDPLVPRRGFFAGADYQLSSKALGSDADFFGLGGRFSLTLPFSLGDHNFALANNSRGATAWTFRNTEFVPITQRYYLGGRTTVRGFRENSLGPRGSDSAIIGGDLLLQNNLELRYFVTPSFATHIFYDTGSVFLRERSVNMDDLRHSTGVGLRYLSPIGPIGFDVGAPLDERSGEPSVRFHFMIGSIF